MTDEDIIMQLRGLLARAVVSGGSDAGETQTVDVTTHAGIIRRTIEVLQPFGLASRAPAGGLTVVLAIGGDQGDLVALPVASPAARFGGLAAGETVLHDSHGNRVALRNGLIEILQATKVKICAPNVEIIAPLGVDITGNVRVIGSISATVDLADASGSLAEMRAIYNDHGHPGGINTDPVAQMT